MTERRRRRLRRIAVVLGLAGVLLAPLTALYLLWMVDSQAARAVDRLQPGMTGLEVQQALAEVPHLNLKTQAGQQVIVEEAGGYVSVQLVDDRVTAVDRRPDQGPLWERTRRGLDRLRRGWEWRLRR